jgi:hypothetical protein
MKAERKRDKMMVAPEVIPEPTCSGMNGPASGKGGLDKKMTAFSTLADQTNLSSPTSEEEVEDEGSINSHQDQDEGEGELQLPVRFYKNGRKRAVPFVL